MKKILFSAIDETEHIYTWDYTTKEKAITLFDVNDAYFAVVTKRREIADETSGTQGDYRDNSYYIWNLYPKNKSELEGEPIERLGMLIERFNEKTQGYDTFSMKDLLVKIRKRTWGSKIKKTKSILLTTGKVYILNGDLVFEGGNNE